MQFRKIVGICVLVGAMTGGPALAEDPGFYVGGSVGQSRQEFTAFKGDDTAFKVFGGWSFNEYFAVEGGFLEGGTRSDSFGTLDLDISSDGFFIEGLAKWPLGKFVAPYAKLGYVFYDTTTKLTSGTQSASSSESEADFIYGGGFEFKLSENFRLRAEYEEVNVPDSAFDIISVGATWHF